MGWPGEGVGGRTGDGRVSGAQGRGPTSLAPSLGHFCPGHPLGTAGHRWGACLLQTATPRAASPELQTHLHVHSTCPGARTTAALARTWGSAIQPPQPGSGAPSCPLSLGLRSNRARPPDEFSPVSPLPWKLLPTACPRAAVPSGPLPPPSDTRACCTAHCLAPSEAQSLFVSCTWTIARAPDSALWGSPGAWLRGRVLSVGQPGCPAWNSCLPPQHSPEAGFAQCPAPTSGHCHPSLQQLQPPPSQCPLCPFWSALPRSTPSMWPPGSCPMDPAGPSREQTLTPWAVGATESFHPRPRCRHIFPGAGAGCGGGTSCGPQCPEHPGPSVWI